MIDTPVADASPRRLSFLDRWLTLFEATTRDLCPPVAATHFIERARRIAESLELGIANANGVLLGVGERYRRRAESRGPAD